MKEGNVLVQCRFDLTDAEVAAFARKRAVIETKIAELDGAFGVEKEKHKNVVGLLEKDASELGMLIRRGYELRDAECRIEFDYVAGLVNTVRVDTGEVVKTRPMSDTEKGEGPPLPLGPSILLSETDPDAQDATECNTCSHLQRYHEEDGCIQPDCGCKIFVHPDPLGVADVEPEAVGEAVADAAL